MRARNRGFGLIEIMVGLVVGLVSMLVIYQFYATFENQKRATTTGADSQTNGTLAQYVLEREIRSAGNGITEGQPQEYPPVTGCKTTVYDANANYLVPATNPAVDSTIINAGTEATIRLAPAIISAGAVVSGRKRPDSITIVSGSTVISAPYAFKSGASYAPGGSSITLVSNAGINFNPAHPTEPKDMVVLIQEDRNNTTVPVPGLNYITPFNCVLLQAMATASTDTVTVTTGTRYNKAGGTTGQITFNNATVPTPPPSLQNKPARLYNLGLVKLSTFRIAANNLVADVTKFGVNPIGGTPVVNSTSYSPMTSNIVNMQAQYGVDTGNSATYLSNCSTNVAAPVGTGDADGTVDPATGWVDPTGVWANDGGNSPSLFNLRRIRAIRIGLVARSAVKEVPKPNDLINYPFYPQCSSTRTQPTIRWDSGPDMNPDLSADPDWMCYRYKVYQTTIPIRNAIWSSTMNPASPSSCGLR